MQADSRKHVVIVGCGFGGLEAVRQLKKADLRITIVDRSNHHLFQPLLYQVATASLASTAIAAPIRHILADQKNALTLMADVISIDPRRRTIQLDDGSIIQYDYLILAPGSTHSYFGHDEWQAVAPGLKTLEDAANIRQRILIAFERAERESNPAIRAALLTFAVIGGGPTGIEMSGTMIEIARLTLRGEFRFINPNEARVVLIEGSPRLLGAYPPDLSAKAEQQLTDLGVEVWTASRVTHIDKEGIRCTTADGERQLAARTVIWSAGVAASPLGRYLGVGLDKAGRVPVQPQLNLSAFPEIYVVGDLATIKVDGKPVPGVSPAAKQMGRTAACNILRCVAGKEQKSFVYRDYGSLATIGRKAAVAMVGKFKFSGYPAWLFWLFVHIYFLIGFRSRLMVMADWAMAYFTFSRSARIINPIDNDKVKPPCKPSNLK